MQIKIEHRSDVDKLLNMCPDHSKSILLETNGFTLGGIYWDENDVVHVYIEIYHITNLDDVYVFMSSYHDPIKCIILDSSSDLKYVLRTCISDDCLLMMTDVYSNLRYIVDRCKDYLGLACKFINDEVILLGVTSTLEDYYYMCLNSDGHIKFYSCAGKFDVIEGELSDDKLKEMVNKQSDGTHLMKEELKEQVTRKRIKHFKNSIEIEIIHV